jgi:undecaprenyl diphosphate synthase
MLQSTCPDHVAIIMDGNGRWATQRGRSRTAGHIAGARAARRVVEAAGRAGVRTLTLYAFSADNWRRPAQEVRALMALFARYLTREAERCATDGVRVQVIGRRDRLDPALVHAIEQAESLTRNGTRLRVRVAIDYSAREAIVSAAAQLDDSTPLDPRARFADALGRAMHDEDPPGDVDLLIRTGGELRLSDFLLWECAYAELWFSDVLWPDFEGTQLRSALDAFAQRERRFGTVAPVTTAA